MCSVDVSIDTDSSPGHELDMEDSQMRRLSISYVEILQLRWFSNRYVKAQHLEAWKALFTPERIDQLPSLEEVLHLLLCSIATEAVTSRCYPIEKMNIRGATIPSKRAPMPFPRDSLWAQLAFANRADGTITYIESMKSGLCLTGSFSKTQLNRLYIVSPARWMSPS